MKLLKVIKGRYTVAAVVDERNHQESCPVYEFFKSLDVHYESSVDGLLAIMERVANEGTQVLSPKQCHYVDQNNKIYEFIKGDLRLFFFKGHCDLIVIATNGIIKKSQKTKRKDTLKAIKYKKQYHQAYDNKNVELLEELP